MFLLLGAILFAFCLVVAVNRSVRRMRQARRRATVAGPPGFDLLELHAMVQRGQISPAEFERLRAVETARSEGARDVREPAKGFEVVVPFPPPPHRHQDNDA